MSVWCCKKHRRVNESNTSFTQMVSLYKETFLCRPGMQNAGRHRSMTHETLRPFVSCHKMDRHESLKALYPLSPRGLPSGGISLGRKMRDSKLEKPVRCTLQ